MTVTKKVDRDSLSCICEGNWRHIIAECRHLIGRKFITTRGEECTFFGVVHSEDDYYYGFHNEDHKIKLLSCVGNLDSWEMKLKEDDDD